MWDHRCDPVIISVAPATRLLRLLKCVTKREQLTKLQKAHLTMIDDQVLSKWRKKGCRHFSAATERHPASPGTAFWQAVVQREFHGDQTLVYSTFWSTVTTESHILDENSRKWYMTNDRWNYKHHILLNGQLKLEDKQICYSDFTVVRHTHAHTWHDS